MDNKTSELAAKIAGYEDGYIGDGQCTRFFSLDIDADVLKTVIALGEKHGLYVACDNNGQWSGYGLVDEQVVGLFKTHQEALVATVEFLRSEYDV